MVLPGFVNGHAHSVEHWSRGLILPLPLELWVLEYVRHEPRGDAGWLGEDSFVKTPSAAVYMSALHTGIESMLSGCTAIMDHFFARNLEDIDAAVAAYKQIGIRAFIAPMLSDDAEKYSNYIPLAPHAATINANKDFAHKGLATGGQFRTRIGKYDPIKTQACLDLWEAAVKKHHDPENGIEIVIGPVTVYCKFVQYFFSCFAW
mgnify:CR=1 FL=1